MTRNEISAALRTVTDGQAFITVGQLAKAMGRADKWRIKDAYLKDLEAVDGKYYLIIDVARVLKERCAMQEGNV